MYDRELNVSLKTKMFLEKIGIKTIGDAYNYDLKRLLWLKKGNRTLSKYLDELWEYMHNLGLGFKEEEQYYSDLKNYYYNLNDLDIEDFFFWTSKTHAYLKSYGTINNFFLTIKEDPNQLKRFLYFNGDLDNIKLLKRIFQSLGERGVCLNFLLDKYVINLRELGPFTPIYKIFQDKTVVNCFIRQNIWFLNDLASLSTKSIKEISGLGNIKRGLAYHDLENLGINLASLEPVDDLELSFASVKIMELDFPLELQEKLLNVGIDTLEKLINLKYLHFLNMREIAILREKLYALGLQDDSKILVMSKEAINKKYTEQLLKIYSSREEINRLELENRGYEMILKLERGKFGDE